MTTNSEWFPKNGFAKHWRAQVTAHLIKECRARARAGGGQLQCRDLDSYQFGVFTGRSLKVMARVWPQLNLTRHFFGFDSFLGISEDDPVADPKAAGATIASSMPWRKGSQRGSSYADSVGQSAKAKPSSPGASLGAFRPGQFSVLSATRSQSVADAVGVVSRYIRHPNRTTLIPGFLNESLTPELAERLGMRPAIYVDIDVDIYRPTFEALDWMLRNRLIVNGTVIGYDDFNFGIPAGFKGRWRAADFAVPARLEGEPRAHREIEKKWNIRMEQIQSVSTTGGQAGWAFTVRNVIF